MARGTKHARLSKFQKAIMAGCSGMGLGLAAQPAVQATTLYWDVNGVTPTTPAGGTGTWDNTTANWSNLITAQAWTSGSDAVFGGTAGTVTMGAPIVANSITFNTANYNISYGGATNTLTVPTIVMNQNDAIAAVLAGSGGLTKSGGGILTLNPTSSDTFTGGVVVAAGTLALDYANFTSTETNLLSATNTLTIGGANSTFSVKAKSNNLPESQAFAGTTIAAGMSSILAQLGTTYQSGQSDKLSLGTITQNVGGTVDFTQPLNAALTQNASNGIITSSTNTNGILGAWATVGKTDYAAVNGTSDIVAATYTNDVYTAGTNTNVTMSTSVSGSSETNNIHFNVSSPLTVTLSGTNTLDSGGILDGSGSSTNAQTVTGGTLARTGGGEMTLISYAGSYTSSGGAIAGGLVIGSSIVDGSSATSLTLNGTGPITLTGSNTYTGNTSIDTSNVVALNSSTGTAIGGNVILRNGTVRQYQSNQIAPTAVVTFNGGALELAGTNLTLGGISGLITSAAIQNSVSSLSTLTLNVSTGSTYTYFGKLFIQSGGTLATVKNGGGTQILANGNLGTTLVVNGGTLQFDTQNGVSSALLPGGGGLNMSNGTLFVISNENDTAIRSGAFGGTTNFLSGDDTIQSNQANASYTLSTAIATNGGTRSTGATINYQLTGGTIGTTNIIRLTNSGFENQGEFYNGADYAYGTGSTTSVRAPIYGTDAGFVTASTVLLAGHDLVASNISNQATISTLNTLKFGTTSNEVDLGLAGGATLNIGTSLTTAGILRSGGGPTTISGGASIKPFASAELVIRTDTAADSLNISTPILANGANALTKSGAGVLTLSGANTYTGTTYVNGGTVFANTSGAAGSSTGTGAVTINNGGTLSGGGNVSGVVAVLSGGTITAGADAAHTGTLTTGAQTWNAGGTYSVLIGSANGSSDRLIMSGLTNAPTAGSFTIQVNGISSYSTFSPGNSYVIADDTTGSFTISSLAVTTTGTAAGQSFSLADASDNDGTGGNYLVLTEAAPEPTSLLLLGIVASPMLLGRRRAKIGCEIDQSLASPTA